MKLLLASSLAALSLAAAAPVMAQSVYIGPNGVGVGVGAPYDAYRDREYLGGGPRYEGRSAYEGRRHERGFGRDRDRAYDRRF